MARYIDADKLTVEVQRYLMPNVDIDGTVAVECAERYFLNLVKKQPTADVVEVVRCKDCIYRNPCGHTCLQDNLWHNDDDFCSYGTPKERGGEK